MKKNFSFILTLAVVLCAVSPAYAMRGQGFSPEEKGELKNHLVAMLSVYANDMHHRGKIREAASIYQRIVRIDPTYPVPKAYQEKIKVPSMKVSAAPNNQALQNIQSKMDEINRNLDHLETRNSMIEQQLDGLSPEPLRQSKRIETRSQTVQIGEGRNQTETLKALESKIAFLKDKLMMVLRQIAEAKKEPFSYRAFKQSMTGTNQGAVPLSDQQRIALRNESISYLQMRIADAEEELSMLVAAPPKNSFRSGRSSATMSGDASPESLAKMEELKKKVGSLNQQLKDRDEKIQTIEKHISQIPSDG